MPNYKKMYFRLFNEITDAIEKLQPIPLFETALVVEKLKQAQCDTEDLYISEDPVDLSVL